MPLWLVDFLTKFLWVVIRNLYPVILAALAKPMSAEDTTTWHEIVRQGATKEDLQAFEKERHLGIKPTGTVTGKIVIKQNTTKHEKDSH